MAAWCCHKLNVESNAEAGYSTPSTRNFLAEERFGLTNQKRRAAVSISSNLAEGCSRSAKTGCTRFLEIATGNVFEVVSQATIGRNQGLLRQTNYEQLYRAAEK
jgi:four helix bundle protein